MTATPDSSSSALNEQTRAAEMAAKEARLRYCQSLEQLRATVATFPVIQQRLGAQEARLEEIERRVLGLNVEIRDFAAEVKRTNDVFNEQVPYEQPAWVATLDVVKKPLQPPEEVEDQGLALAVSPPEPAPEPTQQTPSECSPSKKSVRSVSFNEPRDSSVFTYSLAEFDAIYIPDHGHWLPSAITQKRVSFEQANEFAKHLNGRRVRVPSGESTEEHLDCVVVEPMGKVLSPKEYVSTGLVICLLGSDCPLECKEEWSAALKETRWLDAGLSVAFPDLQVGYGYELANLSSAVRTLLHVVGADFCVIAGKGYGAQLAVQALGSDSELASLVAGVLLVAPGELIEEARERFETPGFLLWAEDDETSPFEQARDWCEAMSRWRGPTVAKDVATGGHKLDKIVSGSASCAPMLLHFVAASLLAVSLRHVARALDERSADAEDTAPDMPERVLRLADELPPYLAKRLGGGGSEAEEDGAVSLALAREARRADAPQTLRRASKQLLDWLRQGMRQLASATE